MNPPEESMPAGAMDARVRILDLVSRAMAGFSIP